jgi:hypothetical protein
MSGLLAQACSGESSPPPVAVTVTLSPAGTALQAGKTQQFAATATGPATLAVLFA